MTGTKRVGYSEAVENSITQESQEPLIEPGNSPGVDTEPTRRRFSKNIKIVAFTFVILVGVAAIIFTANRLRIIFKTSAPAKEKEEVSQDFTPENSTPRDIDSPDNKYTLRLLFENEDSIMLEEESSCKFQILDSSGTDLNINRVINKESVRCSLGMFEPYSNDFGGWAGTTGAVFEFTPGVLVTVNLEDKTTKEYIYDVNSKIFEEKSNNSEDMFLFTENDNIDNSQNYYLIDTAENNTVMEIPFESSARVEAFYDWVNNGYLLAARTHTYTDGEEKTSVAMYYVYLDELRLKNVLFKAPVTIHGRGCTPTKIIPKEKEILFFGDCYPTINENNAEYVSIKI